MTTATVIADPITRQQAVEFIRSTRGRFFACEFQKRGDGSIRRMVCRTGVKRHLKNGQAAYNFSDHGLIPVWDTVKRGYRSIPTPNLLRLEINGVWFPVIHPEPPKPEALTCVLLVTVDSGTDFQRLLVRTVPDGSMEDCTLLDGTGTVKDWLASHRGYRVLSYKPVMKT